MCFERKITMLYKVIKFSDLKEGCWSPLRYCNSCFQCKKVMDCRHDESRAGRTILNEKKIIELKSKIKELKKVIKKDLPVQSMR